MKREEKIAIALAAFEAMLSQNQLWTEYMKRFYVCKHLGNADTIYTTWKKWAKRTPIHKWVKCAFVWNDTPQGYNTWRSLDYAWLTWNCDNFMH